MEKAIGNETGKKSWNPQDAYDRISETINNEWPDWKKRAYNEMFAISAHAEKIMIQK